MSSADDPFEFHLRPPANETAAERAVRLAQEAEAARISAQIDEILKAERAAMRKRKATQISVLLLGQEGSGKTTTLKQFLLNCTSGVFGGERASWRLVVFLNVITSFRLILDVLSSEFEPSAPSGNSEAQSAQVSSIRFGTRGLSFEEIKMRLSPAMHLETELAKQLDMLASKKSSNRDEKKEFTLRAGSSWRRTFERYQHGKPSLPEGVDFDDKDDPGIILNACQEDMVDLWQNTEARALLNTRRINLEDSGFFLDELPRITGRRYMPTDDDILKARIKTVGAAEHSFTFTSGSEKGTDWVIYDVGGARTQRQTWVPFFDEVNTILFLAPISAFDQVLTEDRRVNRLEDSLTLWTELCRNKILANVPLILFLNKCDLLKKKLQSGTKVNKYVTSYADRANEFEAVSSYFKSKFDAIKRHHSDPEREVFIHLTSMTDSKVMGTIIQSVRDMILHLHLRMTSIL